MLSFIPVWRRKQKDLFSDLTTAVQESRSHWEASIQPTLQERAGRLVSPGDRADALHHPRTSSSVSPTSSRGDIGARPLPLEKGWLQPPPFVFHAFLDYPTWVQQNTALEQDPVAQLQRRRGWPPQTQHFHPRQVLRESLPLPAMGPGSTKELKQPQHWGNFKHWARDKATFMNC